MQSTTDLRNCFLHAFSRYSAEGARLRLLKSELTPDSDSADIHGINAQLAILSSAERRYRAARMEYVERLLMSPLNDAHRQPGGPMTKIYIRNLEPNATQESVRSLFATYGNVDRIRITAHRSAARSGSFAFVEMPDAAANEAITALNGSLHLIRARPARSVRKETAD